MKFDLHIHSCLSPCASLEMSPAAIVDAAKAAGMDGIALTDHQSARNAPAIAVCARQAGLGCLFGLEVQTAEEVPTVALFDTVEVALELTDWVYAALPRRKNDPDTFGDQPVVTWDDEIVEMEEKLLAAGCARSIPEVAEFVHARGGLYIAAHVDRPNFSVLGSLGAIPEPFEADTRYFDAIELSRTVHASEWLPKIGDYAVVRSSDAHHLCDVSRVWTEADGTFSIAGLKDIFARKATRLSERITCFSAN